MSINSCSVFDTFEDFFNDVNASFSHLYGDPRSSYRESFPPTNQSIDTDTRSLYLEMALAGYSEDELSLEITNDTLTIRGTLKKSDEPEDPEKGKRVIHQKIKKMNFVRKYSLPTGIYETSEAKASFKDGLLTIVIPKKKVQNEAHLIAINSRD